MTCVYVGAHSASGISRALVAKEGYFDVCMDLKISASRGMKQDVSTYSIR
jgi:hypothetical protein